MKTAIIIAEYNPFHNGHAYQIEAVRSLGFESVAVIMSGNFVQRGEAAIADKSVRARAALECGADLVAELPLPYAMATAERFAFGAVTIANAFAGAAAALLFGSESGGIAELKRTAELLCSEAVDEKIRGFVAQGKSYALSRQLAVLECGGNAELLTRPNDILALEYLRRIILSGRLISAAAIPRKGAEHDSAVTMDRFASASFLRGLCREQGVGAMERYVPKAAMELYLAEEEAGGMPCDTSKLETAVLARLRCMEAEDFARLPDMSEGLPCRLYNISRSASSLEGFVKSATTKRFPSARIRRAAMNAFLGVPAELCRSAPDYLRILGMNSAGEELVRAASRSLRAVASLGSVPERFRLTEARASDIFDLCRPEPQGCGTEYRRRVIKI